jgi:hypothetical protein
MNEVDPELVVGSVDPPVRSWARGRYRIRTRRQCEGGRPECPDCPDCTLNSSLADQWIQED